MLTNGVRGTRTVVEGQVVETAGSLQVELTWWQEFMQVQEARAQAAPGAGQGRHDPQGTRTGNPPRGCGS